MKITIDIPKEFELHFNNNRFKDSLERLKGDAGTFCLAGKYEIELCEMLIEAFENAKTEPPIIFRECPIITLHTKVLCVRNSVLMPRDVEFEAMEIRATNALAKLIYDNRAFTIRETFSERGQRMYEFTLRIAKEGEQHGTTNRQENGGGSET